MFVFIMLILFEPIILITLGLPSGKQRQTDAKLCLASIGIFVFVFRISFTMIDRRHGYTWIFDDLQFGALNLREVKHHSALNPVPVECGP